MNLKSYLKGLGTGIIFALSLCLVLQLNKNSVSDDKAINNKEEVTSSESTTLSDSSALKQNVTINDDSGKEIDSKVSETYEVKDIINNSIENGINDKDNSKDDSNESSIESSNNDSKEDPKETNDFDTKDTVGDRTVIIVISAGQGSETVSSNVAAAGLVEDSYEFNKYLCDNGYDKKLRVGSHEIPVGADEKTIAEILCGQ